MSDKLQLKHLNSAYLSTAKLTTEELKQRLRKLVDYLSGLDQDVNTSSLDEIAASLVQTPILKHKNNDIQLLAACCLADIIQIYAPNAPYDDDQLQSVFKLFIKQLQGLENIQKDKDVDENAKRLTYLLEKLALVKAFVLVIEEEKLIVKLFDTFFKVIRPLHANLIVIHMLDIMVSCLEDSDVIPVSVLEVILSNLLAGKENTSAKMMAQTLIHRAADKLQPFITKFLNDLLVEGKSSETDLSSRAYELIFELNFVNASLLLYVLPQLDNQLKVEDLETRSSAVQLLARMFAAKDSTLPSSYPHLFSAFLGRFKDINPDIRIVMVQFAEHFIINQADDKLLSSVTAELKAKIVDPKEEVRAAAVTSLGNAIRSMNTTRVGTALTGRSSWLTALIHDATQRLRDRNVTVRHAASDALAALWGHARAHWSANALSKSHVDTLPGAVLSLFLLPEAEDKCRAERALVTMINSAQSDAHAEEVSPAKKKNKAAVHKQRVSALLGLVTGLDERGGQALNMLLRDKRAFIDEFKSYLSMRKEHANSDTLAKKAAFLAARLPGSVEKFKATVDDGKEKMMRSFETLLDVSSSTKQIAAARDYLLNGEPDKGKKKRKVSAYVTEIVNKLSMELIHQDDVPYLFEALSDVTKEDEVKVLQFLEVLAASFPKFFTNSFDSLTELLGSDSDEMVDNALRMLTNIGKVIADVEEDNLSQMVSDVQKKLSALCSHGTPVQAKYAVRALQYVSKNAASSNGKLFKDLIGKLSDKKDGKQATVLRALAELCVRAADKVQDEVVDVAQQVLLKTWKGNNTAELKCLAIALLRNYFLIRTEPTGKSKKNKKDDADPRAVQFVDQLFDLIEGDSALLTGAKEDDQTQVRTAAASAVLKLARQKRYDELVTLERYQQLAHLIVAGESELRGELLEKLYKGLRGVNQLPLRYLAYFALYGNDREHVVKAKKYFAACVQTRRQFLKQNQDQFVHEEPEDEAHSKKSMPNAVKVIMRVMPEYSLPWTVHLLAHLPYFEEDSPSYTVTVKYLNMWMETVLRGSSTNAGNRSLVRQALVDIRQTNDAQDADNHNVHTVAELAYRILNEHYAITAVQDKQANMETFYLPQTLFTMPEKLLSLSQTFLPDDYHLPAGKNKFQQLLAETDKKKAKESDEEQSEEELEDKRRNKKKNDEESESEVRPKGKKRKAAEEPEETESRPNKKSKRAEETAKGNKSKKVEEEDVAEETNTRTKSKKNKKAEVVEEEEQDDEPQTRTKAKKNKSEAQEEPATKGKKGKRAEPVEEEDEPVKETKGKKGQKNKKAEPLEEEEEPVKETKGKKGKKSVVQDEPRKGKKTKPEPVEEEEEEEPKPAAKKQNKSKTADKKGKAEETAKSDKSPNKKRKRDASDEEDQEEPEITHKRKQRKTSK